LEEKDLTNANKFVIIFFRGGAMRKLIDILKEMQSKESNAEYKKALGYSANMLEDTCDDCSGMPNCPVYRKHGWCVEYVSTPGK
jgi:hypothetical protein